MPCMSAHMAIATKLSKLLPVDKDDFIKGNILPDLYDDKEKSHYKIKGKIYEIPNINIAVKSLNLTNSLDIGYLSHLLLDKYYFDEYLTKYDYDLFKNDAIYRDYDILNIDIINHFNIDIDYIKNVLSNYLKEFNNKKLVDNISYLDIKKEGNTKVLNKMEFLDFLDKASIKIEKDIINIISKKN